MSLADALSLPEGPRRTAAIAAWIQSLFPEDTRVPVLVGGANAFLLYRTCRDFIDVDRLTTRAREDGFESALDALQTFDAMWPETEPDPETLEAWANKGPGDEAS